MSQFESRSSMQIADREARTAEKKAKKGFLGKGCDDLTGFDKPETTLSRLRVVAPETGHMVVGVQVGVGDESVDGFDLVRYNPDNIKPRMFDREDYPGGQLAIDDELVDANADYLRLLAKGKDIVDDQYNTFAKKRELQRTARCIFNIPGPDGALPVLTESERSFLIEVAIANALAQRFL